MSGFIYRVHSNYPGDLICGAVEVVKRGPKRVTVKSSAASGYRTNIDSHAMRNYADTPKAAWEMALRDHDARIQSMRKRLAQLEKQRQYCLEQLAKLNG